MIVSIENLKENTFFLILPPLRYLIFEKNEKKPSAQSFYIMVRRYRRRIVNKDKYSIEQTVLATPSVETWSLIPADEQAETRASRQYSVAILPPSDLQGMRKIKHLTFTISNNSHDDATTPQLLYAIVYVPQGYNPQTLNFPAIGGATQLYPANQYVMSSGVLDFSGGPLRIRSPLSRNLNSGDSIYIVFASPDTSGVAFTAEVKYAITLQ